MMSLPVMDNTTPLNSTTPTPWTAWSPLDSTTPQTAPLPLDSTPQTEPPLWTAPPPGQHTPHQQACGSHPSYWNAFLLKSVTGFRALSIYTVPTYCKVYWLCNHYLICKFLNQEGCWWHWARLKVLLHNCKCSMVLCFQLMPIAST